jgi:uncharacterized protein (DUF952 family)
MPTGRIFHVVTAADPAAAGGSGPLATEQFERHGFVHCCFREQLAEVATWWFDAADDLVALEIDPARLTSELRLEPSPSRWYPHLYGPIDGAAVVATHPLVAFDAAAGGSRPLPSALVEPPAGYQLTALVSGDDGAVVQWSADGALRGHAGWIGRARAALSEGRTVELVGGIVVPATLDRAYESYALLETVTDDGSPIVRYDGDGFFTPLR